MPTRRLPACPAAYARKSASAARRRDSMASACPSKTRPASVSVTVRRPRERSTRRCPSSVSRFVMWSLTVESDAFSSAAAAQNVPVSATALRARRCFSSTLCQLSGTAKSYVENPGYFGDSRWQTDGMGLLYAALIFLAFDVLVALWGADSRPTDAERPT